jgi:hypothetical protein
MPDNLDDFLSKKLNTTYSTAPEDLWNKIAVDLNDIEFDNNLKNQFNENSSKAPEFLWTGIEENLNPDAASSDAKLDNLLKSAYDKKAKAPEHIWYSIEQKLNIDAIWNNMSAELNRMKSFYVWRKRVVRWGLVALLLLFARNCDFGFNEGIKYSKIENSLEVKSAKKENILSENNKNNSNANTTSKEENLSENTILPKGAAFKKPDFIAQIVKDSSQNNVKPHAGGLNDQFIAPDFISQDQIINQNNNVLSDLDLSTITKIQGTDRIFTVEVNIPEIDKKKKELRINYDIGLITALSQSVPLNSRNAKTSLRSSTGQVNSISPMSLSYGIQVGVEIGNNVSLSSELFYRSTIRREFFTTNGGNASKYFVDFNYFRTNLVVNSSLLKYGTLKNNIVKAGVGFFFSNLQSFNVVDNQNLRYFVNPEINGWNAGIIASVSQQHVFYKHFAIEYGIRTDAGFSLIFDQDVTKNYQNSNTVGTGFFASLKYKF